MTCNFKPRVTHVYFNQDYDGYSETHDVQNLNVDVYENYVAINTERWACSPDELRKLADAIEKIITESYGGELNKSTLGEQVKQAQAEYDSWPEEKRASVQLEGGNHDRPKQ